MYDYHHLWNIQGLYLGLDSNKRFVGWLTAGENKLDKWGHIKWQSWAWYICCRSNFKPGLPMLRVCSWCRDICFSCLHWCSGAFLISRVANCWACEILVVYTFEGDLSLNLSKEECEEPRSDEVEVVWHIQFTWGYDWGCWSRQGVLWNPLERCVSCWFPFWWVS